MYRYLAAAQAAILGGGVIVAWSSVARDISAFVGTYGTLLRFRDCVMPNPLTTACFFGASALLVAFVWSLVLLQREGARGRRHLGYLLLAGTIFAFVVLGYEFLEYYHIFSFESVRVSCSPGVYPLQTPCFYGALCFLTAYIVSRVMARPGSSRVSDA